MTAPYHATHVPPSRWCVRCGRRPRTVGTYLCEPCQGDPRTHRDIARAQGACPTWEAQRAYLVARLAWAGGWPASW